MPAETYELPNGKILHRWTDRQGQAWACMEYDHGPMCRRCQPVDDVLDGCLNNVVDGLMEARQTDERGFEFKMTDEGNRQAAKLISDLAGDDVG
jgi:hypothetical protein